MKIQKKQIKIMKERLKQYRRYLRTGIPEGPEECGLCNGSVPPCTECVLYVGGSFGAPAVNCNPLKLISLMARSILGGAFISSDLDFELEPDERCDSAFIDSAKLIVVYAHYCEIKEQFENNLKRQI